MSHDHDAEPVEMPDCVMKRAIDIATNRMEREQKGVSLFNDVKHLFPRELDEEAALTIMQLFMHNGGHNGMEFASAATDGMDPHELPLCFVAAAAFAEGVFYGSLAQALYEQETREELAALPEVKP